MNPQVPAHTKTIRLDLTGLKCPLPVLRTRKALRQMAIGDRLEVLVTDPMSAIDIPHFISQTGNELMASTQQKDELHFVIRKIIASDEN